LLDREVVVPVRRRSRPFPCVLALVGAGNSFLGANDRDAAVSIADALIPSFEELPLALDALVRAADPRPVGRP
jgi:hypothetical protein